MSFVAVGSCPHCGAPIYAPMMWHGILPPPCSYSCSCRPTTSAYTTTDIVVFHEREEHVVTDDVQTWGIKPVRVVVK